MIEKFRLFIQIARDEGLGPSLHSVRMYNQNTIRRLCDTETTVSIKDVSAVFHTPRGQAYFLVTEDKIIEDVLNEIQSDDVFWDIGANVGMFSCFVGNSADVKMVAFEPHPENYKTLKKNIRKNSLTATSKLMELGLGDFSGQETLYLSESSREHSTVEQNGEQINIKVRRGDDVSADIGYPDVVKIDVEGAETQVLSGMPQTLSQCRVVYCEVHNFLGVENITVRKVLEGHGFMVSKIESTERTTNLVGRRSD